MSRLQLFIMQMKDTYNPCHRISHHGFLRVSILILIVLLVIICAISITYFLFRETFYDLFEYTCSFFEDAWEVSVKIFSTRSLGISVITVVGLLVIVWTVIILLRGYVGTIKAKEALRRAELFRSLTIKQKATFKLFQILYSQMEKALGFLDGLRSVKAEEKGEDSQYQPLEQEYSHRFQEIENHIKDIRSDLDAATSKDQNAKDIYDKEMQSIDLLMESKIIGDQEASKRKREAQRKIKRLERNIEKARFIRDGDSSAYYGGYKDVPLAYSPRPMTLHVCSLLEWLKFTKGQFVLTIAAILMIIGFIGLRGFQRAGNVIGGASSTISEAVILYPLLNNLSDFELYFIVSHIFYPLLSAIFIAALLIALRKRISMLRSLVGFVFFFYPLVLGAYYVPRILLSSGSLVEESPGELKLLDPELNINLFLYLVGITVLILYVILHIATNLFETRFPLIQRLFPVMACMFAVLIFLLPYEGYNHNSVLKLAMWGETALLSKGTLSSWVSNHNILFWIIMPSCLCASLVYVIELFKPSGAGITRYVKPLLLVIFLGAAVYMGLRTMGLFTAVLILGWLALGIGGRVDIIETKQGTSS